MNIVFIGAHPDDCEVFGGGTATKWSRIGHAVTFISLTNGNKGHHEMAGPELTTRRRHEAKASAERGGVSHMVLDNPDGELEPTLFVRREITQLLRRLQADVVLTHRPHDYHPDHRYTSIVVQDCAFMVTVPAFCPDTPALRVNPTFFYMMDSFTKPLPFYPDVAVDVDDVMDVKWAMMDAMESQFYEWLAWLEGLDAPKQDRIEWLKTTWSPFFEHFTNRLRAGLARRYGHDHAEGVRFAEGFELCEYGRHPGDDELQELFRFEPAQRG